jgi:hypothetical protein
MSSLSGFLNLGVGLSGSTVIVPPAGTNYAPQPVTFEAIPGGLMLLGVSCVFGPVSGSWGTLTVAGVTDQAGNPLAPAATLQSPFTPANGQLVTVPAGDISIVMGSQFSVAPVGSAPGNQQGTLTSGSASLASGAYTMVLASGARSAIAIQNTSNSDRISLIVGATSQPVSGAVPSAIIPPFASWPPPSMGDFVSTDTIWAISSHEGTIVSFLIGS